MFEKNEDLIITIYAKNMTSCGNKSYFFIFSVTIITMKAQT